MKKTVLIFSSAILSLFILSGCANTSKNMIAQNNGKVYFVSEAECKSYKKVEKDNVLICKDEKGNATYHKPMSKEAMQLQMHKEQIKAIKSSKNSDFNSLCGYRRYCY